jgi:membrane-bound lytic murein transglycosylase MltF
LNSQPANGSRQRPHRSNRAFKGLTEIAERGFVRIAVPHNPLFFAFDGKQRIGLSVERARLLEKYLTKVTGKPIMAMLFPRPRNDMLRLLANGNVG